MDLVFGLAIGFGVGWSYSKVKGVWKRIKQGKKI